MNYLFALVVEVEFGEEFNSFVTGWVKVASWNSLNLEEKKHFI